MVAPLHAQATEPASTLTPNPMAVGQYTTLAELGGTGTAAELPFLAHVEWHSDEQAIIYAINTGINSAEVKDWLWWQYDINSHQNQPLDAPQSLLSDEIRQTLNLCPLHETDWEGPSHCRYLTSLFESAAHGMVVYSPLLVEQFPYSEGELWIAQMDGSNAQKLAEFAPAYVNWSSDGKWFVTGQSMAGLPGQVVHYLAARDGSFFASLQQITGIDNFYLNGLFPLFSPDGKQLLFAGSAIKESRTAADYKLYSLNLDNLESRLVSHKFGLFQWAEDSQGIYVLDGAFLPFEMSDIGHMRQTHLHYVDIIKESPQAHLIADDIPYHPFSYYGSWQWAYSPEHTAIAYVGFSQDLALGILQLEP